MKYKKSQRKIAKRIENLKTLVYGNYRLTNKELAKKLNISEKEFYRGKYNIIANDLKVIYKKQSLFD